MKKQIALAVLAIGVSFGAVAQGSLDGIISTFINDSITTPGLNATNPALATTWFTGNATIALYYAPAGAVTQSQIDAINALDGTIVGGAVAVALPEALPDGFVKVSATSLNGGEAGAVSGYAVDDGWFSAGSDTIGLLPPVPTGGSGWLAMVVTADGGQYNGYEGVLAWWQPNLGGNPWTGNPAAIVPDPAGLNLVLTPINPCNPGRADETGGSLSDIQNTFVADGITTPGLNATNPASATTRFTGNATIALYVPGLEAVTQSQINAINALDGTGDGGAAAVALLGADGFVEVSATSLTGSTAGAVSGYVVDNGAFSEGPDTIGLLYPVPTGGSGWLAMVVTAVGGQYNGYEGVLAWWQPNLGGNPWTGSPAGIVADPAGLNLVLTPVTPIPAPGTLASISYMLPDFGSSPVPQFNPTNGQLASVSLTSAGGGAMEVVSVISVGCPQPYFWFCGVGSFNMSVPGSSLAISTSCSMSTNFGFIAPESESVGDSYGSFNSATNNTSQAADLNFFTGTNSVTVDMSSGCSVCGLTLSGRRPMDYSPAETTIFLNNALRYYYAPPPPPIPIIGLTCASSAVWPTFSNLIVGTNYQLQVSTNLNGTFTDYGSAFAATNSSMVYPQYFDVANWSQLFLRVRTSP